ncbi:MAG: radical SAM protein [Spirochaetes bacterium]|nr:radical SAM protein [Spirochaetota bacterium]
MPVGKNFELLSSIVYGPVPSRRLGQSLGINNIPPKYCTYSCVYCQLGKNKQIGIDRREFYSPSFIVKQTMEKISEAMEKNERIDYITFVPDGEPTLDINIGTSIQMLKDTGIKIAVITNSSLLTEKTVRKDILGADWISLKIDSFKEDKWHAINRPYKSLNIKEIQEAMIKFAGQFSGHLATETMLVDGFNTNPEELDRIADFISLLKPHTSYISIPIRPPAVKKVSAPNEAVVNMAYQIFIEKIGRVECITGHEGNDFAHTGSIVDDILSITSVHPMREDSMKSYLSETGDDWEVITELIQENKLSEIEFNNKKYYLRKFGYCDTIQPK